MTQTRGRPSKGARDTIVIRPRPELGAQLRQDARRLGLTHGEYVVMLAAEELGMPHFVPARSIRQPGEDHTNPRIVNGKDFISARPPTAFGNIIKERATLTGQSSGAYLLSVVEQATSRSRTSRPPAGDVGSANDGCHEPDDDQEERAHDEQQTGSPTAIRAEFGPKEMAAAFVKRPGLYLGFPPTLVRAMAFIHGFEMALLMAGDTLSFDWPRPELHQPPSRTEHTTAEQQHEDIRALLPTFEDLFAAASRIKRWRQG